MAKSRKMLSTYRNDFCSTKYNNNRTIIRIISPIVAHIPNVWVYQTLCSHNGSYRLQYGNRLLAITRSYRLKTSLYFVAQFWEEGRRYIHFCYETER